MKKLERKEMKNLKGGVVDASTAGSCSMTYQNSNGQWITEQGNCQVAQVSGIGGYGTVHVPFCYTSSFHSPQTLSSNGGVSRCGAPFYQA